MKTNKDLDCVVDSIDSWCVVNHFKDILFRSFDFWNCVVYIEDNSDSEELFIVLEGDL